ncbi:FAD binding domain-containing protein [Alkalihalobacillus trypoxylicola]|uniref:FAD-binding PCMH-type domain-containing protein n=1 Tax=Alkalihalobacillus trypoxylicola TaxID=519424 RepID=A0A162F5H2_9BACI|nr:FAD binding domain-containing protein [Alkalihalobacillus trypoxylicola]KYG34832.1 hypothetical protein AZF04_00410 [Alkalihalobacillus trypoxylicola]
MSHVPQIWLPVTIEEAWKIKNTFRNNSAYIAGGTILRLQEEKGISKPDHLISLREIPSLQEVSHSQNDFLSIGSNVTLSYLLKHPFIQKYQNSLISAVKEIAAPGIRNQATIGGNIGYQYGDLIHVLLSLNAQILWYDGVSEQTSLLHEFLELMINQAETFSNAIIINILIPNRAADYDHTFYFEKIGRREAFTPSIISISCYLELQKGFKIDECRIAVSSSQHFPERLLRTERLMKGKTLTKEEINEMYKVILLEYNPVDDPFASAEYKKRMAANLLASFLVEKLLERSEIHS